MCKGWAFVLILFFVSTSGFGQMEAHSKVKTRLVKDLDSLDLQTGDLVFFQSMTFESIMTQLGTLSPFTHSSMVVKAEDGTLWLTHSTNNNYDGFLIPVIGEQEARSGVILTRMDDLFISVDNGESPYYRHIWIRRLNEDQIDRPSRDEVLTLYHKYIGHPFETSNFRFTLSAFDLFVCGRDLLRLPPNDLWMCSEYMVHVMKDLSFPIPFREEAHETTPADIYHLTDGYYDPPIIYRFKDGEYHIE
jgi:hypothetical protein